MTALVLCVAITAGLAGPVDVTPTGTIDTGLLMPARLAATPAGGVYVTDQLGGQVLEYDAMGALVDAYAVPELPVGIAVANDGTVYVSRRDGAVGMYDPAFTELGTFDASLTGMTAPNDMAVDTGTGDIFVVDSAENRVLIFNAAGTQTGAFGSEGSGIGQFRSPQAIAIYEADDLIFVADTDNFRVQVFDLGNLTFQYKFGYKTLYAPTGEVAWFARSEGLAFDACGDVLVTDALMGTVRAFSLMGQELDPQFLPVLDYGDVALPCDLLVNGSTLYVASSYDGTVEVYDATCTRQLAPRGLAAVPGSVKGVSPEVKDPASSDSLPEPPDNPYVIVEAIETGAYVSDLDLNGDRHVNLTDLRIAVEGFGAATVEDFLNMGANSRNPYPAPLIPPHLPNYEHTCGRCHSMDNLPGGMLDVDGQENLCLSCHMPGGVAMATALQPMGNGFTHPVGVAADAGNATGPAAGTEMSYHLDNGDIRCGTCHDPHEQDDAPYLRGTVINANLCGECHTEAEEWHHSGHGDPTGDAWVHYDWSLPNRAACRMCHSGNGFIDFSNGLPPEEQNGMFRTLDCASCHAAHGKSQDEELLRLYGEVVLPGDVTVTDAQANATCMVCHNGRTVPADGGTPHYALAGVMLEGINANLFGATVMNSAHTEVAGCVQCHMVPGPAAGNPGAGKVGGHTFAMIVHDPDDPDYGFEHLAGCNAAECHGNTGALTSFNRMAYGDYDGDGVVEGVQDEVAALSDLVFAELHNAGAVFLGHYPYWDFSGVLDDPPGFLQTVRDVVWNWEYVDNSGDFGIHNTAYAVAVLQISYEALTGSTVPGADLRYQPAGVTPTVVAIQGVNGGSPVEPGGAFTVDLTIEDGEGNALPIDTLNRLRLYVAGPNTHYQRVIEQDSNMSHFVQNVDGSYTYTAVDPFPAVYAAPENDSPDITEGEWTGLPLVDGTYTVLIESRRTFGSIRRAGDATFDFVVANDLLNPPALASRAVVTQADCNACHNDLQIHGGGRFAVAGCVVCHNAGAEDLITDPPTTPGVGIEFAEMIHRLHRGHDLPNIRASANSTDPYRYEIIGHGESVHDFSDIGSPIIPGGIGDCETCHATAAQGDDIYTNAASVTREKCVGCHDDLNFADGTVLNFNHPDVDAGIVPQTDLWQTAYRADIGHTFTNGSCLGCHAAGGFVPVMGVHQHPTHPDQEGTQPVLDIVAVGGMTGGGGTYFVAGDTPEVTFSLLDDQGVPVQLADGNTSILDRLEFYVAGPTTQYQQITGANRPWSSGHLAVDPSQWVDNFAVDGTYTFTFNDAFPAEFPAQPNALGEPPAELIFSYDEGWGQLYTVGGTPLHNGSYSIIGLGRRLTPTDGEREPLHADHFEVAFGADEPIVPYNGAVTTEKCNACHGVLAFHGNQREGVVTCMACHTAGSQDGGTYESVDLRIMVHKLHNARNLTNLPYELNGHGGIADFSDLLISSMPGEAAECHVCHATDSWKNPPVRAEMRTWMVACTSCHDATETRDHADLMTIPGTFEELCGLCHGEGMPFAVEAVHANP